MRIQEQIQATSPLFAVDVKSTTRRRKRCRASCRKPHLGWHKIKSDEESPRLTPTVFGRDSVLFRVKQHSDIDRRLLVQASTHADGF